MVFYQTSKPLLSEASHPLTPLTGQWPTFPDSIVSSAMLIKPFHLTFYLLIPKSLEPNTFSEIPQLIIVELHEKNH